MQIQWFTQRAKKRVLCSVLGIFLSTSFLAWGWWLAIFALGPDLPQITTSAPWRDKIDAGTDQGIIDDVKNMEKYVQALYLIMWPSLAIAGASLDNSLVYGEAFFLEKSLFSFRQLMRTFANFALGFIFVWSILFAFFRPNQEWGWVVKLMKRLVIAGLLINMSRWMVASLIDFSTIATTAMGWLPLHVMGEIEEWKDLRLLKSHSLIDNSEIDNEIITKMTRSTIYSCEGNQPREFFIPCPINNNILFDAQWAATEPLTLNSEIQRYAQAWEWRTLLAWDTGSDALGSLQLPVTEDDFSKQYCVYGNTLISYDDGVTLTSQSQLEKLKAAGAAYMKNTECATMTDLVEKATASTGPLFALYGSILHMATISQTSNFGNAAEILIELIMKVFVWAALVIPLLALALALVVRVVFLWLIIAFSPILVLAYVFDFGKINEINKGKFKIGTVIWLIFLPVFAVFSVSISVIFLTVLGNIDMIETRHEKAETAKDQPDWWKNDIVTILWLAERIEGEEGEKCYDFKITTLCFSESTRKTGADIVNVMVRSVINFFGIALMWTTIFLVLKGNQVTAWVANGIEKLAVSGLKSIKFIPMPNGPTSVGAMQAAAGWLNRQFQWIHQKQFRDSGRFNQSDNQQITDGVKQLKNSPSSIATFDAAEWSSPDAYNEAVPKMVQEINREADKRNDALKVSADTNSMEGLMASPAFARYYMTHKNQDYGMALNKLVKSDNKWVRARYTGKYIESLEALANDPEAKSNGKVLADQQDPNDPKRKITYIWVDNKLVSIPYKEVESGGEKVKIAEFDNIRQYDLPNGPLAESNHVSQYKHLLKDGWVTKNNQSLLPQEIKDMYRGSIKGAVQTAYNDLPSDEQDQPVVAVTIPLWWENVDINVSTKKAWNKRILQWIAFDTNS